MPLFNIGIVIYNWFDLKYTLLRANYSCITDHDKILLQKIALMNQMDLKTSYHFASGHARISGQETV